MFKKPSDYYKQDLYKLISLLVSNSKKVGYAENLELNNRYDYIILPNSLVLVDDIQNYISKLKKYCDEDTRVVVVYFNFLWKPILDMASKIGLRKSYSEEPNWLTSEDFNNLFMLEGFQEIKRGRRMLLPLDLGFISTILNNFFGQLPIINSFCVITYQVFSLKRPTRDYSVSIIIPARNEEGNISGILKKLPKFKEGLEAIFVEGNSTDSTYAAIEREIKENPKIKARLLKQSGKGKADAVRLGFDEAKNDILMILDADITVPPSDLDKFYKVIAEGYGDFINGSRLVYPMEKDAMRTLNYIGNKFFSLMFTFLLGQHIKDTLCGTKVLFNKDYQKIVANRKYFGEFDPFGDFDLLFGAAKLNLKIIEVPVRYKERIYGTTNISRFHHGLLLVKMVVFAARKLKFI